VEARSGQHRAKARSPAPCCGAARVRRTGRCRILELGAGDGWKRWLRFYEMTSPDPGGPTATISQSRIGGFSGTLNAKVIRISPQCATDCSPRPHRDADAGGGSALSSRSRGFQPVPNCGNETITFSAERGGAVGAALGARRFPLPGCCSPANRRLCPGRWRHTSRNRYVSNCALGFRAPLFVPASRSTRSRADLCDQPLPRHSSAFRLPSGGWCKLRFRVAGIRR